MHNDVNNNANLPMPFPDALQEFSVATSGLSAQNGMHAGASVNAVTKSGTNRYSGAAFGYLRQDEAAGIKLTGRDFLGRRPVDFKAQQYGFSLGGPIIKDRMHFFFALDKQTRNEPRPVFVDAGSSDAAVRANGINPDTLANLLRIARDLYSWDLDREVGQFAANTDEDAFFGRIDWQINNTHKLTLRDNYTKTDLSQDRLFVSPTSQDLLSDAGFNTDRSNSLVASLQSVFGGGLSNEFRTQVAYERKPRPSNPAVAFGVPMPEVRVNNIVSALSDGTQITTGIRFGADPVLHANNIEEETYEVIDNLRWARGDHTFKFGFNGLKVHAYNLFFNNGLGTFQFNSMAEFEAGTPTSFQRTLPLPGQPIPVADYNVYETAVYAQDEWQISPRLFVNYGLRYDYGWFPDKPDFNPDLTSAFPYLDVRNQPNDKNNFSPRFGFTFDPGANGEQVIRGGTGIFYGRSPYVLWSNALLATGVTQLSLNCTSTNGVPIPDFPAYAADYSNIPTSCTGGGSAAAAVPTVMLFDKNYEQSYSWKSNLGYDRLVAENWRVGVEGVYSTVRDNYILQDDNFNPVPRFRIEGNIPVFVDPSTINTGNGAVNIVNSRRNTNFNQVLVERSLGSTLTYQGIVSLNGRTRWGQLYASYTYDNSRDNGSLGCCTTGTMFANGRVAGNVNDFNDQWGPSDWNRRHTLVVAPQFTLPWGFKGSAIFRYFTGLPYTPRYNFDINGDGSSNDRVYIPTAAEVQSQVLFAGATAEEQSAQRSLLEQKIGQSKCLREHRGEIATRNMCRSGPNKVLDARVAKQFSVIGGQSIELQADFFNVLNGLNPKWGRRLEVQEANSALLIPSGFDTATNRYRYRVNTDFGRRAPAVNFQTAQFQMQLGLRYNF